MRNCLCESTFVRLVAVLLNFWQRASSALSSGCSSCSVVAGGSVCINSSWRASCASCAVSVCLVVVADRVTGPAPSRASASNLVLSEPTPWLILGQGKS